MWSGTASIFFGCGSMYIYCRIRVLWRGCMYVCIYISEYTAASEDCRKCIYTHILPHPRTIEGVYIYTAASEDCRGCRYTYIYTAASEEYRGCVCIYIYCRIRGLTRVCIYIGYFTEVLGQYEGISHTPSIDCTDPQLTIPNVSSSAAESALALMN